ncbi:MAG: hypothetical protein ACHQQQ_08295 [Bacteroidota bacterium]
MLYLSKFTEMLSIRKISFVIILFIVLMHAGCEPISVVPTPTDFDKTATINGYVVPDTVQINQLFNVQVSFQSACNENIVGVRRENFNTRIVYTPIVHQYPGQNCNTPVVYTTAPETLGIYSGGLDTIEIVGSQAISLKPVYAVGIVNHPAQYKFHFLFTNSTGGDAQYAATFQRLSEPIAKSITTDANGYWDTTFTDTLPKIKYKISGISFEAVRGVTESGVILTQ